MNKILLYSIVTIVTLCQGMYSQDFSQWENCSEGMWGNNTFDLLFANGNDLYTKNQTPFAYSTNAGKTWLYQKTLDSTTGQQMYIIQTNIHTIDSFFILNSFGTLYLSRNKKNWEKINYSLPKIQSIADVSLALILKFISIKNHLITKISWYRKDTIDTNKIVELYRTCIGKIQNIENKKIIVFDTIPAVYDDQTTKVNRFFHYYNFDGTLYTIHYTSNKSYFKQYYYSTDDGWSWQKREVPEILGGIKSLAKINGKIWIISPLALWRPKESGSYEKVVDDKFDNFNTDFLIEHKGMIYAQAIDSSNHKPILVRSKDDGKSWEKVGNIDYRITQMFSINGELVAVSFPFSVIATTDDGETWEERNRGLFASSDYLYEGPWCKIIKVGNNYLTVPRNKMLRNVIMKSYDGGKTWERKLVIPSVGYTSEYLWAQYNYNFTVNYNKYGLFAVDQGSNKTYISYDQGESWEKYSDVSTFFLDNDKNMYERGDTLFFLYEYYLTPQQKNIYYSLDTGRTWVMYDSLFLKKLPEKSEFLFVRDGKYFCTRKSDMSVFKSTDDGKTWNYDRSMNLKLPDTLSYKIIYFTVTSKDTVLIYGEDSYTSLSYPIYISKDFGRSFVQSKVPYINGKKRPGKFKFIYLNQKLFLLILDFNQYVSNLVMYDEQSNQWINLSPNLDGNIITDITAVEDYLYISTVEGLFRIKTDPVSVGEQNEKVTLKPIELYPNPASDKVRIQNNYYNLTNLQVFDIYGREQKISNYTGEEFDVSHLQSGIYIVKLTFDGSWYVAKKFVKM